MKIDDTLQATDLARPIARLFDIAASKVKALDASWDSSKGTPVFTVAGKYTSRGWTEWTQGFQFGAGILQFDATEDAWHLQYGRENTVKLMASHVSHFGVHDHG